MSSRSWLVSDRDVCVKEEKTFVSMYRSFRSYLINSQHIRYCRYYITHFFCANPRPLTANQNR